MLRVTIPLVAVLVAACGGAQTGAGGANEPGGSGNGSGDENLADFAASHGGIPSLGTQGEDVFNTDGLRLDLVEKDKPVKLDGVLMEWPARTPARTVVKGSADPHLFFSVVLQYDASKIYVGGEVSDEKLVRTEHFGDGEDHASF